MKMVDEQTLRGVGHPTDGKVKNGARRDDVGRTRLDLIPPVVLLELGFVFKHDADKHGDNDWRLGMKWGRLYADAMQHMLHWWNGHWINGESGQQHLVHAISILMMLVEYEALGIGEDDRPDRTGHYAWGKVPEEAGRQESKAQ